VPFAVVCIARAEREVGCILMVSIGKSGSIDTTQIGMNVPKLQPSATLLKEIKVKQAEWVNLRVDLTIAKRNVC